MILKITLGYWLDSDSYPDALGENDASVGTVVTGFNGLIGILETQLGLNSPQVSENIRISEWQEFIRQLDTGNLPFSKSFETDSWNTAKELLRRRDELILSGWDPNFHVGGGKWIDTLAQLERSNQNKTPGFPDRVRLLLSKLQEQNQLKIEKITIVDENLTLWDPWSVQLINSLKELGIEVETEKIPFEKREEPTSDLALLQAVLEGELEPSEAGGDGSLLLIRSEQELDAADFLISWLQEHGTENTVLIKGEGSILLDELLHRRGVPAAGVDAATKWRAVLQVLPLTIDTYWQPLRVGRMLELLTIPTSPVPGLIRYKLANALANSPGIGGPQWTKAIEDGIQAHEELWQAEELEEQEIKKQRKNLEARLDLWVRHDYYDPNEGMPLEKLVEICQKVGQWATTRYHLTNDFMYVHATKVADEVIKGIKTLGVGKVTHLQVARILDSVLGEGAKLTDYYQEAAKWKVVNHPGQIWGQADTILWWGFNKNMSGPSIRTWTSKEREWLGEQGINLVGEDVHRRREAAFWQRAARLANKRLLLFAPAKVKGEEISVHPLWDEIRYAVAKEHSTVRKITIDGADLRKKSDHGLFGKEFSRVALNTRKIPEPIRKWTVPENVVLPRKEESATSLEGLIGCPLKWTLRYAAHVRPGNILSLPNESRMLGNLGHAILEQLITEKPSWNEEEVKMRAGEWFDELTPKLAATLLEPQHRIDFNEIRTKLQKSLQQFFKVLNNAGIQIEHTEMELQKSWNDNVDFKGRLDLVGKTRTGNKMLIDAKWSKYPKGYQKRLETLSVQLSLYHWLLVDNENEEWPVAYFMLRSGDFFSLPHDEFPSDYHVDGPSLTDSHQIVRKSVEDVWSQLSKGVVIAPGIPALTESNQNSENNVDEFVPAIDPPCGFCEYQNLCGVRRVKQ